MSLYSLIRLYPYKLVLAISSSMIISILPFSVYPLYYLLHLDLGIYPTSSSMPQMPHPTWSNKLSYLPQVAPSSDLLKSQPGCIVDDGQETSVQHQCTFVCSPLRTDLCFLHGATSATSGASITKSLSTQTNLSSTRWHTLCEFVLNVLGLKLTLPCSTHPHAFFSQDNSDYELPLPQDSPLHVCSTIPRPACRVLSELDKASMPVSSPVCSAGCLVHSLSLFKPGAVAPSLVVLAAQQVMALSNKLGPQFEHFIKNLTAIHSTINSAATATTNSRSVFAC